MNDRLLDASALLALFNQEPGQELVASVLPHARIASLNLAEVVGKLVEHGVPTAEVRQSVMELGIQIEPFSAEMAFIAGELRVKTRHLGLSLGDRGCLACALRLGLPLMTADQAWRPLDIGLDITVIR